MYLPTIFKSKYRLRVLYKSGNSHEFWVSRFSWERDSQSNLTVKWDAVSHANKPIIFGVDDVEAVYTIAVRQNIFTAITDPFFNKE